MNEAKQQPEPLRPNPVWFLRTTPATYLRKIAKLRKQHTANCAADNWHYNQTVERKIRENWEAFHKLSTHFRSHGDVCFWCGGRAAKHVFAGVVPSVDAPWEVFCSPRHCEQFGIIKGQT